MADKSTYFQKAYRELCQHYSRMSLPRKLEAQRSHREALRHATTKKEARAHQRHLTIIQKSLDGENYLEEADDE